PRFGEHDQEKDPVNPGSIRGRDVCQVLVEMQGEIDQGAHAEPRFSQHTRFARTRWIPGNENNHPDSGISGIREPSRFLIFGAGSYDPIPEIPESRCLFRSSNPKIPQIRCVLRSSQETPQMDRFGSAPVPYPSAARSDAERVGAFLRATYGWMAAGIGVTAIVALALASSRDLAIAIIRNPFGMIGLVIAQFAVVIYLSARVNRIAPTTAAALFLGYSALTGVTFSIILLAYTRESVAETFFVCAGMFGALAA